MRDPYYCPYCNHRSTRRWNLDVHIKRRHGEYLVGRSFGQYVANNPPLYNQNVHLGHVTVADNAGNRFQPRYIPEQTLLAVSPNIANPMYRHMPTTDGQSYGTSLSWGAVRKIQELKGLMNKY